MASKNKGSKDPSPALIEQFCAVTGADKNLATSMLVACNNNLELAIEMQMEGGGSSTSQPSTSASCMEPVVRAPIPQVQEKLVEDSYQYGFRGRRRAATRSVFDGFRDFEAEMRQQEQARREGGAAGTINSNQRKRKTLEELFRPPIDLMHKGSFNTAKNAGASSNRWLMVNIQNAKEFPCQVLNRDIWSNQAVKSIIREHFVFWQVYHDSEEGRQYMQFYNIKEWPYVAIIDPVTGENMVVWNKLDCNTFCELVTGFLSLHPSLDGTTSPPCKRNRTDSSIVDASEDSQLQEALKKSVEETKACTEPILPDLTDDDDSLSENDDLETFSDSDNEDRSVSNTPVKKSKTDSGAKSSTNGSKLLSTTKTAECGDSVMEKQSQVLNKNCPELTENGKATMQSGGESSSASDDDKYCKRASTWRNYLGDTEDPESKLQIRFPDGKKEQLNIPSTSKLMAIVQYVIEAGFSNERYELVTNYPRRKLSYLAFGATLKSVGLFPQETIFVQER